jgi:two-component system, OmpR family, response regulator QseB
MPPGRNCATKRRYALAGAECAYLYDDEVNAMRLLLVEDDAMIGAAARDGLQRIGFVVDWVRDGRAASAAIATDVADLVVLDLGLPHKDGLQVLAEMRAAGNTTPVLILTARDAITDKIAGLDAGADDYVIKPFDIAELGARIRAVLRRRAGRADSLIKHGDLELNLSTRQVARNGTDVPLSPREFAILAALLERPGLVLSRRQLEDRLYGWSDEVESNALEVHIHSLRKKLGHDFIRTVRGVGYAVAKTS